MPDWPDGMNHKPCRKPVAFGDFGIAGLTAAQRLTFFEKITACRPMNRTIHTTAAKQGAISGIHDGVYREGGDIDALDVDVSHKSLLRG